MGEDFKPLTTKYNAQMLDSIKNAETIQTEESANELQFMQYTEDLSD